MRGSQLLTARIRHDPWQLETVEPRISSNTLGDLVRVQLDRPPDRARFGRHLRVLATTTTRVGP